MLAAGYKIAGEDWLKTLFTDMEPVIVDNARQVTDGVIRGDFAVGIGTDNEVLNECLEAGGCQNIKLVPFNYMHSLAISIPKNPPNPAAAKVFVNWLLSKEGQDRSEEHTSELQSLIRISYAVFCLKTKKRH